MPKPEKKGVEQNHYLDHIVENHIVIREAMQDFSNNVADYRDTMAFVTKLFPIRDQMMAMRMSMDTIVRSSANDSLILSSSDQLFNQYNQIIHEDFKVLFDIYIGLEGDPSAQQQEQIDSVWQVIGAKDEAALANFIGFGKLKTEQQEKLVPLTP